MAEVQQKVKLFNKQCQTKGHAYSSVKRWVKNKIKIYSRHAAGGWPVLKRIEHRHIQIARPVCGPDDQ